MYHNQGLQEDLTQALKNTKVPVLFLGGDPATGGAVLWGKGVDNVRETKPDALYAMVTGAAHGTHVDNPRSFHTAFTEFIDGKLKQNEPLAGLDSPLMPYETHYRVFGDEKNPKTVILLNGSNGDSSKFNDLAASLSRKFRVVIYDPRGTGYSRGRGTNYSSNVMANDLKALMDSLGIANADIMGEGLGGKTALRFAANNPGRVKSLVLYGAQVESEKAPQPRAPLSSSLTKDYYYSYEDRHEIVEKLEKSYSPQEADQIARRFIRQTKDGQYYLKAGFQWESQAGSEDLSPTLKGLKMPVMLVPSVQGNVGLNPAQLADLQKTNPQLKISVAPKRDSDLQSHVQPFWEQLPQ
jgi:pimeloyl-ACP methyl ester carboxylesterase